MDTTTLLADWGFQSQGRWWGSFTSFFIPYLGNGWGAQHRCLALPCLLWPWPHPTSLPQFPHCYLLGIQEHSNHIVLTHQAVRSPKHKRQTRALTVCFALHHSILLSAKGAAAEGGAQQQVGVHPFTSLPGFCAGQQLPPGFLHWEQAPAQTKADVTALCPATSKRTYLSNTTSAGCSGILPWHVDPNGAEGESSPTGWHPSAPLHTSKNSSVSGAGQGHKAVEAAQRQIRSAPGALVFAKQHQSPSIRVIARTSLRGESSHLISPLVAASHSSYHPSSRDNLHWVHPGVTNWTACSYSRLQCAATGLVWKLPDFGSSLTRKPQGTTAVMGGMMGTPKTTHILCFLFSFIPVTLMERYSLPAHTLHPFRL